MGVRGLTGLLTRFAPNAIEMHPLAAFSGSRLAIDGTLLLQQALFRPHAVIETFPHRHMHSFFHLSKRLESLDILPIFIFDDPSFAWPQKERERRRRRAARDLNLTRLQLEVSRADRIKQLTRVSEQIKDLNEVEKAFVLSDLRKTTVPETSITTDPDLLIIKADVEGLATQISGTPEFATKTQKLLSSNEQELFDILISDEAMEGMVDESITSLDKILKSSTSLLASYSLRTSVSYLDWKSMQAEVIELLQALGNPVCTATNHEGEALAAHLTTNTFGEAVADAVVSEDTDAMVFAQGQSIMLRRLATAAESALPELQNGGHSNISIMRLDPVQARSDIPRTSESDTVVSKLSPQAWIDLCILLGTDFCPHLPGVGPITARKMMREHGSIEEAVKAAPEKLTAKWMSADLLTTSSQQEWMGQYLHNVQEARKVFNAVPSWPEQFPRTGVTRRDPDNGMVEALQKIHLIQSASLAESW